MKVLQINSVCGIGSTGRIATDLYQVLNEQGHDCLIAYGRGNAPEGINAYRIGSDLDVKLHGVYTRLTDKTGFASKKATERLLEKIKEYNPDVIHLHNLHGYYINIEVLFNYLSTADKSVVWTMHDCWAFTGHCPHFTIVKCELWRTSCYNCPQRTAYPTSLLLDNSKWNYENKKRLFTSVDGMKIIAVSNWLQQIMVKSFLGKYSMETIYNGIDLNIFQPVESKIRSKYRIENKFMVLGVSDGWNERKGLPYFIQLAKGAADDTVFVLVGLTKQQIKKLPRNIIGLTRTSNVNELVELYSAADIFLNLSREETFGMVTAESLACGTPAIVFNATACPELLDETCGFVVPTGSVADLEKALNAIKTNTPSQIACVERAKLFDKTERYNDYINIYKEVLSCTVLQEMS